MEEKVKDLIRGSLNKRLVGHGNIDNIYSNSELVEQWLTRIMALGFNQCKIEPAAKDILEIQINLIPNRSIEAIRAELFVAIERFGSEINAFLQYVRLRDTQPEEVVLRKVQEELQDVEERDFYYF
ncbi:MAG: hypothetical protein K6D59_03890 [Bacteroidales bacterium]|nr:hypothetical protein [Bacteroidales bacterium]